MSRFASRSGICFQWNTQSGWDEAPTPQRTQAQIDADKAAKISAQYALITAHFRVIHVYQLCGWDNGAYKEAEDPGAATLLGLAAASNAALNGAAPVQVVQGTLNGALANFTDASTGATNAANWASTLLAQFDSAAACLQTVRAIVVGNEIDQQPAIGSDGAKLTLLIDNLYAGLDAAGLGAIPITSTFANIGSKTYPNDVAQALVKAIYDAWKPGWNGGVPFAFANHYTDGMTSTDASTATDYIEAARAWYNGSLGMPDLQLYVGEIGYSESDGASNQATVDNAVFQWIGQQDAGAPVCVFQAFDQSLVADARKQQYGLYDGDAAKDGIDLSLLPSS